ncbi:MAG: type II toxin-antitoxin system HicB family antitoxin [Acaryochloris sp. CRU_2_0]|nr:type II toxin-antitoxin system HicB family antitoxin [Acaryochloris sp. CRU_2_0]
MTQTKYRMVIDWSEEDQCFVVSLPEFEQVMQPVTDGQTYEEVAKHGHEALESLMEFYAAEGWALPEPHPLQVV